MTKHATAPPVAGNGPPLMNVALQGLLEICGTMFGITLEASGPVKRLTDAQGLAYGGSISLIHNGGSWELGLFGGEQGCKGLVRVMLAMEETEDPAPSDILDALGEFVNMVSGVLKRSVASSAREVSIGVPLFLVGDDCALFVPRKIEVLAQPLRGEGFEGEVLLVWSERTPLAIAEEIEACLTDIKGSDKHLLGQVLSLFEELSETFPEGQGDNVKQWTSDGSPVLMQVINDELKGREEKALAWVRESTQVLITALRERRPDDFAPPLVPDLTAEAGAAAGEPEQEVPQVPVERDEGMLETLGDFLPESEEGLDKCDQILMALEQGSKDPDAINALFRVFHSIKGVAGFLEMGDATKLAHTAETLLAKARDGAITLQGPSLDLVFESVESMRQHLARVRTAVEENLSYPGIPGLTSLLSRLEAAIRGETPAPAVLMRDPNAATGPATARASVAPAKALKESVKVDVELIERLTELGTKFATSQANIEKSDFFRKLDDRDRALLAEFMQLGGEVREVSSTMRMVSVSSVFQKMARLVRDLSKKTNKLARMVLVGEETTMPRNFVEKIGDPLVHMIRNSLDHGVEVTEARKTSGKALLATIQLAAQREAKRVVFELSDDGRGLDPNKILDKAISKKLVPENHNLSETEIFQLIFAPGFSTAEAVTALSGRGVGMDVVKRNIESLGGTIQIASRLGAGTTFTMVLPLTGQA